NRHPGGRSSYVPEGPPGGVGGLVLSASRSAHVGFFKASGLSGHRGGHAGTPFACPSWYPALYISLRSSSGTTLSPSPCHSIPSPEMPPRSAQVSTSFFPQSRGCCMLSRSARLCLWTVLQSSQED